MRLSEYIKALAPSKGRSWFLVVSALIVPTYKQLLGLVGLEVHGPTVSELAMIEAAALIVILFVSGYLAWSEERAKNDTEWMGLNYDQRQAITKSITGTNKIPEVWIFNSDTPDCKRLGGDLSYSLDPVWSVARPHYDAFAAPLPSGFLIQADSNDARAGILQLSLKKLGIDARVDYENGARFTILIGSKVR